MIEMSALTIRQPEASLCVIPRPAPTSGPYPPSCSGCGALDFDPCAVDCPEPTPGRWQPDPFKTIETRSWPAPKSLIGQRIAIHAAVKRPPKLWANDARPDQPFTWTRKPPDDATAAMLASGAWSLDRWPFDGQSCGDGDHWAAWWVGPLGAVVGTAVLAACVPMVGPTDRNDENCLIVQTPEIGLRIIERQTHAAHAWRIIGCEDQRPFGHFEPGRWAWLLTDAERLAEPIPCRGYQGVWRLPADVAERLTA